MDRHLGLSFSLLLVWFLGCSSPQNAPPPPLVKVSGNVKLDGKAMNGGEVRFSIPGQPVREMKIKDGAFTGEAYAGKNRVEVYLEIDGPPATTDPKLHLKINTIADKYWGPGSTLHADVSESGPNEFKFDVTRK